MNGVVVKIVGSKLVVEVDILKAIAEGVGADRPISTDKPGPKPKTSSPVATPVRGGSRYEFESPEVTMADVPVGRMRGQKRSLTPLPERA